VTQVGPIHNKETGRKISKQRGGEKELLVEGLKRKIPTSLVKENLSGAENASKREGGEPPEGEMRCLKWGEAEKVGGKNPSEARN